MKLWVGFAYRPDGTVIPGTQPRAISSWIPWKIAAFVGKYRSFAQRRSRKSASAYYVAWALACAMISRDETHLLSVFCVWPGTHSYITRGAGSGSKPLRSFKRLCDAHSNYECAGKGKYHRLFFASHSRQRRPFRLFRNDSGRKFGVWVVDKEEPACLPCRT